MHARVHVHSCKQSPHRTSASSVSRSTYIAVLAPCISLSFDDPWFSDSEAAWSSASPVAWLAFTRLRIKPLGSLETVLCSQCLPANTLAKHGTSWPLWHLSASLGLCLWASQRCSEMPCQGALSVPGHLAEAICYADAARKDQKSKCNHYRVLMDVDGCCVFGTRNFTHMSRVF